jgi:hypothetical protein
METLKILVALGRVRVEIIGLQKNLKIIKKNIRGQVFIL